MWWAWKSSKSRCTNGTRLYILVSASLSSSKKLFEIFGTIALDESSSYQTVSTQTPTLPIVIHPSAYMWKRCLHQSLPCHKLGQTAMKLSFGTSSNFEHKTKTRYRYWGSGNRYGEEKRIRENGAQIWGTELRMTMGISLNHNRSTLPVISSAESCFTVSTFLVKLG